MKKIFFSAALLALTVGCSQPENDLSVTVLSDSIRYCESVLVDGDRLLVANFGTEELNPLNQEGRGYILEVAGDSTRTLIPADSILSGPKGMRIRDNHLYIADVGKLVIYDLNALDSLPRVVPFPEGELFVNDLAFMDSLLYVTVTDAGKLYRLDVNAPADSLQWVADIPGANGIVINGCTAYVASYPPDGVTTAANVIYRIDDLQNPQVDRLTERQGQYDGLVLSADGRKLYFTSWEEGQIGYYNFDNGEVSLLDLTEVPAGPARMDIQGNKLYIPDLPNSRVIVVSQKSDF